MNVRILALVYSLLTTSAVGAGMSRTVPQAAPDRVQDLATKIQTKWREEAIRKLRLLGKDLEPALARLATDKDPTVRAKAARAVGALSTNNRFVILKELVHDGNRRVRQAALDVLVQMFPERVGLSIVASAGEEALPFVKAQLASTDPNTVYSAIWVLQYVDADVFPLLRAGVRSRDPVVRLNATKALFALADRPAAIPPLGHVIRGALSEEWWIAARTLARHENPTALQIISDRIPQMPEEQQAKAYGLLSLYGESILPILVRALKDRSVRVRHDLVITLGLANYAYRFSEVFERALSDSSPDVRRVAVWALGQAGRFSLLFPIAEDPLSPLREQALDSLVRALPYRDSPVSDRIARIGKAAIPSLVHALRARYWQQKEAAAITLAKIGPDGLDELLKIIGGAGPNAKPAAVYGLGYSEDPRAYSALIETLSHESATVRKNAAEALGVLANPQAVPHLRRLAADADRRVASQAVGSISRIGGESAALALLTIMEESEALRPTAARLFARVAAKIPGSVEAALLHESEEIRREVLQSLGRETTPSESAVRIALTDGSARIRLLGISLARGPRAKRFAPDLRRLISDRDANVRVRAAAALAPHDPSVLRTVTTELARAEPRLDTTWLSLAMHALRDSANPNHTAALVAYTKHEDTDVARMAIGIARKLESTEATAAVIACLSDLREQIRAAAAEAFQLNPVPEAVPPLIEALEDESESVVNHAIRALGASQDRRATEPLIRFLHAEKDDVYNLAIDALIRLGDPNAAAPLLRIGQSEDGDRRWRAIWALGHLKNRRVVPALLRIFSDKTEGSVVRATAASALGRIGDPRALPALRKTRNDSHSNIRESAARAATLIEKARRSGLAA